MTKVNQLNAWVTSEDNETTLFPMKGMSRSRPEIRGLVGLNVPRVIRW